MSLRKTSGQPGILSVPRDGKCSSCCKPRLEEDVWMSGDEMYCERCATGTLPIPDCPIVEYQWDDRSAAYLVEGLHVSCADRCSHTCANWFKIRVYPGNMASYEECCKSCRAAHQLANRIKAGAFAFPSTEDLQLMRVADLKEMRTKIFGKQKFRPRDNVRDKLLKLLESARGDAERAGACRHSVN